MRTNSLIIALALSVSPALAQPEMAWIYTDGAGKSHVCRYREIPKQYRFPVRVGAFGEVLDDEPPVNDPVAYAHSAAPLQPVLTWKQRAANKVKAVGKGIRKVVIFVNPFVQFTGSTVQTIYPFLPKGGIL